MAGAAGLAVLADLAGWLGFSAFSGGSGASGGSGGSAGSGIAATSGLSLSASPLCSLPRGLKLMQLSSIRILVLPSFFLLGLLYFSTTSSSEPGENSSSCSTEPAISAIEANIRNFHHDSWVTHSAVASKPRCNQIASVFKVSCTFGRGNM